jgi:diaminohydroxyphosphoribosylaminopyrimidine deaminase/5-amino-6-(5-phosphoribosylamino)uracil reductase
LLTRGEAVTGWETLHSPRDVYGLHDVNDLLVEGGSATASAFLTEDLVDRILIYRAPIIVGEGKSSFGYVGLDSIADAHGRWDLIDEQRLGVDRLEVYERVRDS